MRSRPTLSGEILRGLEPGGAASDNELKQPISLTSKLTYAIATYAYRGERSIGCTDALPPPATSLGCIPTETAG